MSEHAIHHLPRRVLFDEPHRDLGGRARRDHAADLAAFHHVDTERRKIQTFLQRRGGAVGRAESVQLPHRLAVVGHFLHHLQRRRRERQHVVVEPVDRHLAGRSHHRPDQLGEPHVGVGQPVAVIAAVHRALRGIDAHGQAGAAARAVIDGRIAARVLRPVHDEQHVGAQLVRVVPDDEVERGAAAFFLAVQNHPDVLCRLAANRVHRRHKGLNGSLVVARRSRVDAPGVGERRSARPVANLPGAFFERAGPDDRRPRIRPASSPPCPPAARRSECRRGWCGSRPARAVRRRPAAWTASPRFPVSCRDARASGAGTRRCA